MATVIDFGATVGTAPDCFVGEPKPVRIQVTGPTILTVAASIKRMLEATGQATSPVTFGLTLSPGQDVAEVLRFLTDECHLEVTVKE